jgi:arylsulfatase A
MTRSSRSKSILSRRRHLCLALALLLATFFSSPSFAAKPPLDQTARLPNFVMFYIDDMGWRDVGFAGNDFIETPHVDRLAREGVIFTNAYSSAPNCAPARACLMSGQYTPRHGVYTVVDDRHTPGSAHHKVLSAQSNESMATEVVTIAEQLKVGGYGTAMFGMWNLGRGSNNPVSPTGQGFDVFMQPRDVGFEKDRFFDAKGEYLTDRFTDEGLRYIEKNREDPFFVYFAYHAVHSPFEPKPELLAKYEGKSNPQRQDPAYAATVEAVDQNVGRVMETLERLGLDENTVVIFTSDNGGNRRATAPLRDGKGTLYEGGIRVPTCVWGPGIAKGIVNDEPILGLDFYPTMLQLAGVESNTDHVLDGRSLVPLLTGAETSLGRERVFWHFPCYIGGGGPSSAMRAGDYKVIEFFEDERVEVYNLAKDPGEQNDLAQRERAKADELIAELRAWQRESGAALVTEANPAYDPNAPPKRGRDERGKGGGGGQKKK